MNVDAVEHLSPFFVITEKANMILALFILLVIRLYGVYIQFKKHKPLILFIMSNVLMVLALSCLPVAYL
jgi:hypothetical protein